MITEKDHPFDEENLWGIYAMGFRTLNHRYPWLKNWFDKKKAHAGFIKLGRKICSKTFLKIMTTLPLLMAFWVEGVYVLFLVTSSLKRVYNSPNPSPYPNEASKTQHDAKPMNTYLAIFLLLLSLYVIVEATIWAVGNLIHKCSNWFLYKVVVWLKGRVVGKVVQPWLFSNFVMNSSILLIWGHNFHLLFWFGAFSISLAATICLIYGRKDDMGILDGLTTCYYICTLTLFTSHPHRILICIVSLVVLVFLILCTVGPGPGENTNQESGSGNDDSSTRRGDLEKGQDQSTTSRGGEGQPQLTKAGDPSPSATRSPKSTDSGPARPLRLVHCDENGELRLDPEAVSVLQLVKGPICVVSVCGRDLQGKSFILNRLLGKSNGFQVASAHKPCTKGLWMWSAPLKRTALDGTEYNLVFLDSEGIDACDKWGTYSAQIFSLAVLLSSMFIHNQMGSIEESAPDHLSLVTEMAKHIRVKASGGKGISSELEQFSPIFVWLLRDFYLDLVEDNKRITPRDYLEISLRPVQGAEKDLMGKNEIRESIRALFPYHECFMLVWPLNSEHALQRLDQTPLEKSRPEFAARLDALTEFVFERTRPKQVGATVMTGPFLAGMTQSFLDALNKGAVPTISSSWQVPFEKSDDKGEQKDHSSDIVKPIKGNSLRESLIDVGDISKVENDRSSRYIVHGLTNLGNTCYLGAVIQNLLSMEPLRDYLLRLKFGGSLTIELKKLLVEIISGSKDEIRPGKLLELIRAKAPKFVEDQQHDSYELLERLLDELSTEELEVRKKDDKSSNSRPVLVQKVFGGQLSSTVSCMNCGHSTTKYDPILDLTLELPPKKLSSREPAVLEDKGVPLSIDTCLAHFTKAEILSNGNRWHCENCSKVESMDVGSESPAVLRDATKRILIDSAPSILTIHLKRFRQETGGHSSKLSVPVRFEETFDLKPYMDPKSAGKEEYTYCLLGIVEHSGTISQGHYTAYVRSDKDNGGSTWYNANDSCVREVSLTDVLSSEAYILFYGKREQMKNLKSLNQTPRGKVEVNAHLASSSPTAGDLKPHRVGNVPSYCSSFKCDERAEKRKEFHSKLEEKTHAKEVEKSTSQGKSKETQKAKLRNKLAFKARPMPNFYQKPAPAKVKFKKKAPTIPKSPKLGRQKRSHVANTRSDASQRDRPVRMSLAERVSKDSPAKGTHPQQSEQSLKKSLPKSPSEKFPLPKESDVTSTQQSSEAGLNHDGEPDQNIKDASLAETSHIEP